MHLQGGFRERCNAEVTDGETFKVNSLDRTVSSSP